MLWGVISDHFKLDGEAEKFFVMLAPNGEAAFRPPSGHSGDFYFSPPSNSTAYGLPVPISKKRKSGKNIKKEKSP